MGGLAKSRLEALLAMASGAVSEPVAGLAGLVGALRGGTAQGVRNIDATRDALTYAPRDPRGMQEIQAVVAPIAEKWGQLRSYLGDTAARHGASPALSTAAYMVPDTLAALLGARGIGIKGPTLAQMAERSAAPSGLGRQVGAIGAWHKSPHSFDKFSLDAVGTGTGAQSYGHGLYFADRAQSAIDNAPPGGRLYQVDLAPNEADLLDWNKPLHAQSPQVRKALDDFGWAQDDMTGGEFYRSLGFDYAPSPAEASRRLKELGIPGTRYQTADGGNNYVMFDDKGITIKGKN